MRPVIAIFVLILAAIGLAVYTSSQHPGDPNSVSPAEQTQAAQEKQTQAAQEKRSHEPPPPKAVPPVDSQKAFDAVKTGAITAALEIENRGLLKLELYPQAAPKTVAHIVELCKKRFYDGIKIHRLEPNFVVQMGDPELKNVEPDQFEALGIGSHGSGTTVPLEARLPNIPNSLGLARSEALDSGDSQFYINLNNNTALDNKYCVFGRVVDGIAIIPKLQKGDRIKRFNIIQMQ